MEVTEDEREVLGKTITELMMNYWLEEGDQGVLEELIDEGCPGIRNTHSDQELVEEALFASAITKDGCWNNSPGIEEIAFMVGLTKADVEKLSDNTALMDALYHYAEWELEESDITWEQWLCKRLNV